MKLFDDNKQVGKSESCTKAEFLQNVFIKWNGRWLPKRKAKMTI